MSADPHDACSTSPMSVETQPSVPVPRSSESAAHMSEASFVFHKSNTHIPRKVRIT